MQLRQAHAIRILYYQGVDIRNVNARLDYRGANQYIYLALEQLAPDLAQFILAHLAVGYADYGIGQHIFYFCSRVLYALNAVMQIIHLPAAPKLRVHRLREHFGIVLDNIGLHRRAVVRRLLENRHIAYAGERHVERPRYGRRGQGENIDLRIKLLELLLLSHAEALLLVYYYQPEVTELNIL